MLFFNRFTALAVIALFAGAYARADEMPSTAEVLGKLHSNNVKEMRMGLLAIQHGTSQEIQNYGKTLVDDHDAADLKVVRLAKDEKITLAANTPPVSTEALPRGAAFDVAFAKMMVK